MQTTIKQLVYEAWAPINARWSPWVKPVLFAHMTAQAEFQEIAWGKLEVTFPPQSEPMAVVLDLPGAAGVHLGIEFARRGWRPVPLYNSIPAPLGHSLAGRMTMVETGSIMTALWHGAAILPTLALPDEAPPVFLLDSSRRGTTTPTEGDFDNRSISFPSDFPSANLLLHHGIRKALLIQPGRSKPQPDLAHTLRRWQEAGVELFGNSMEAGSLPEPLVVDRPHRFMVMYHRMLEIIGLRPAALGGFGGLLHDGSSGG